MQEYVLTIDLKDDPELIAKYKKHHEAVWPSVMEGLDEVGVRSMKIFLLGTRMFMMMTAVEEFEPERDFKRYLTLDPKNQEWEDLMGTFQQVVPQAGPNEKWAAMEKVFDFEDQLKERS